MDEGCKKGVDTGEHGRYPWQIPAVVLGRCENLEMFGKEERQEFLTDGWWERKVGDKVKIFDWIF